MRAGDIHGREINAITINADIAPEIFSVEGGYKICVHAGRMKAVVWSKQFYAAPAYCGTKPIAKAQRSCFVIPAKRDCMS